MTGIYKITNLINNKCYIGKSIHIETRWSEHLRNYKYINRPTYHYPLYLAMRKYGIDNFSFEILEITKENDKILSEREKYYYEIFKPEYNLMIPDESISSYLRKKVYKIDMKTLEVVSSYEGVNVAAKETGLKRSGISNVLTGRAKSCGGYYWCFEDQYNNWKKPEPQYSPKWKKIAQLDKNNNLIKVFDNITIAAKETGTERRDITAVAKNKRKAANGFIWRYV